MKDSFIGRILAGCLIGGAIGAAAGIVGMISRIVSTTSGIIALTVLGAALGAVGGVLAGPSPEEGKKKEKDCEEDQRPKRWTPANISNHARLQLREEQLEISKELMHTAEVTSHKERITEEKTITVPVTREELIIEKKNLSSEEDGSEGKSSEIMRIPISEERVEIVKHPVQLEDVSIYTKQYEETEHIEETIKKEKAHIETSGDVKVAEERNDMK